MKTIARIAFYTLVRREISRFLRIWSQTLLPSAVTMTLYFLIFGQLIGAKIGSMGDVPYITYIVPGLIVMSMLTNAYANTVASFFGQRFQRSIEEMLVSPMPISVLLTGFMVGGICRGIAVGIIVTSIAFFFTPLHCYHGGILVVMSVLTCMIFSLAGMINGIFAKKFDDINIVPTFILTPLSYLGGIFYSTELLPPFWQKMSLLNPILYIVNAFRYGFLGKSDVPVISALLMTGSFAAVLYGCAYYLLKKGIGIRT